MTSRIMVRRTITQTPSDTAASHGNFDTAACGDAFATRMRNMTAPLGTLCQAGDQDRSGFPSYAPEISDRPD